MDNVIKYENFLPDVRESLYRRNQSGVKASVSNNRKLKKVKFNSNSKTSSQNSNVKNEEKKQNKLNGRKGTPYKKRREELHKEHDSCSHNQQSSKLKKNQAAVTTPRKKQLVISFSSSDSFEEELENVQVTPSKSELETFQTNINKAFKRKKDDTSDSDSDDDESCEDFDLDAFFKTRDMNELSESSFTEAHSGINHEFVSDFAKDVKIIEGEYFCNQDEGIKLDIDNKDEDDEEVAKENISEFHQNRDNSPEADKIQQPIIVSDENCAKYSPTECQPVEEENKYCAADYHDFGDRKLVVLKEKQSISFHGLFTLKVLHGEVEVLGKIIDNNSNPANLYCPRGSALLCIKNVTASTSGVVDIRKFIPAQNTLENVNYFGANCAIFLCIKLEDPKIAFLEKYISQKIFPKLEQDETPQVVFEPRNFNRVRTSSMWDDILDSVNSDTKLMIVGGKGVGKTTLLRFAMNRLLNKFGEVRVLDFDPGQSEFALPGCVSVVTVTEPVFGPNFTHLKPTDRSLLTNIDVGHDPRAYIKCIESLNSYLETLETTCPTLINYIGFSQRIGLNIVASAINCIRPTDIIQINSKFQNKNFSVDLTYKEVEENCRLFSGGDTTHFNSEKLTYTLHKVQAMNDENDGWVLQSRSSREMCLLGYFGQMMGNGVNSLISDELPMYEISLSEIKITNLEGQEIIPAVANANMVALCSLEQESNIFVCLGYGVIRGIDLEDDKLVLITPEEPSVLERVHYLVVGSVSLPPSVYMTPDDAVGTIPYVMDGELVSLGQITKRSYLPVNKK